MCELFSYQGEDSHLIYKNIVEPVSLDRKIDVRRLLFIRENINKLWKYFGPYADRHFVKEFALNPNERYWEMYLAYCLRDMGFKISSVDHGPDFLLEVDNCKIWIEAVSPNRGDNEADMVKEFKIGHGAQRVPRENIILRYTSALREKERKYKEYLASGIVEDNSIKIIALSSGSLRGWPDGDTLPFIFSALFPIGHEFLSVDRITGEVVDRGREYEPAISKANQSKVETTFFVDEARSDISAVIYTNSDLGNPPAKHGDDIILVHNPTAKNPLPKNFFSFSREYWVDQEGELQES